MLNKLHQRHGNNRNYLKPKSDINTSFGLNHFAGVVFYDTRAFLEKNRDTASTDILVRSDIIYYICRHLKYIWNLDSTSHGKE